VESGRGIERYLSVGLCFNVWVCVRGQGLDGEDQIRKEEGQGAPVRGEEERGGGRGREGGRGGVGGEKGRKKGKKGGRDGGEEATSIILASAAWFSRNTFMPYLFCFGF